MIAVAAGKLARQRTVLLVLLALPLAWLVLYTGGYDDYTVSVIQNYIPHFLIRDDVTSYLALHDDVIAASRWHGQPLPTDVNQGRTSLEDYADYEKMTISGGINISGLATVPLNDVMEEWEWRLLRERPLTDSLRGGNHTTTQLVEVRPRSHYRVGESVRVRVDVRDGLGRQLRQGGDDVRVAMQEPGRGAYLGMEVEDLGNGSYMADVPLLWPGKPVISAKMQYNAGFIRAFYKIQNAIKDVRTYLGGFSRGDVSEATICSHFHLPLYQKPVCNLTQYNGGVAWYCGHPVRTNLTCEDWTSTKDVMFVDPLPLTDAEQAFNRHVKSRSALTTILLDVRENKDEDKLSLPPLGLRQKENFLSWSVESPRGHFMNHTWVPRYYNQMPLNKSQMIQCLRNTTIFLNGDSNVRIMFEILSSRIGHTFSDKGKWHHPLHYVDEDNDINMHWYIHGLPFHGGVFDWCARSDYKHVVDILDDIPAEGNFVVLLHMYLHYSPHHYSLLVHHLRAARAAMIRCLERNPSVKIIVRGPHRADEKFNWQPIHGGDIVASLYTRLYRREFKGLYDRIFFLAPWDMSIGVPHGDFHPEAFVNEGIADVFVDYVCSTSES